MTTGELQGASLMWRRGDDHHDICRWLGMSWQGLRKHVIARPDLFPPREIRTGRPRKLTDEQARDALRRHGEGTSWASLGREYGASCMTVKRAAERVEKEDA